MKEKIINTNKGKIKSLVASVLALPVFMSGVASAGENLEVKARVCDGSPMTIITKNGKVVYGIADSGISTFEPVCYKRNKDPSIYVVGYGGNVKEEKQSCYYATQGEKLNWSNADIKPEDVKILKEGKNIYLDVKGIKCNCPQ